MGVRDVGEKVKKGRVKRGEETRRTEEGRENKSVK